VPDLWSRWQETLVKLALSEMREKWRSRGRRAGRRGVSEPQAPKIEPIREPTLFEVEKLELAGNIANMLSIERPHSEPGIYLGTSSFTAAG